MQTTLSELLKKITPLPYEGFTRYIIKDGRFLATAHAVGDEAPSSLGFSPGQEPRQSMEQAEANGAYLRHCANVLPEVVEALRGLLADPCFASEPAITTARAALAKAENITT